MTFIMIVYQPKEHRSLVAEAEAHKRIQKGREAILKDRLTTVSEVEGTTTSSRFQNDKRAMVWEEEIYTREMVK